jgi:hypothetical protein
VNKREKILAGLLLCLVVAWGGKKLLERYRDSVELSENNLQSAREQLFNAQMTLKMGDRSMRQLEKWQDMSLPPNRDVALSLYRAWLLEKTEGAGLKVEDINPNLRTTSSTSFGSIGYIVEARGTLAAVTKFLYEFYRSAQLHQITKLALTSAPGSPELRVSLQVEALVLPGSSHTDSLPDGQSDRLRLAKLDDYEKSITGRDIFKTYTPPRPPRPPRVVRTPPKPPEFDDAAHAFVTGIVQIGPRLQAWITVRTTGEVLRLYEGDEVEVGELKGKVESISSRMVVVKTEDDKPLRVQLGHSLRDGESEKAEAGAAPAPSSSPSDS